MISGKYIEDMLRAVRRSKTENTSEEITDLILEARADMIGAGIAKEKVEDESDPLIKGAIRSFVRWKFGLNDTGSESNRRDYIVQIDSIRRNLQYAAQEE